MNMNFVDVFELLRVDTENNSVVSSLTIYFFSILQIYSLCSLLDPGTGPQWLRTLLLFLFLLSDFQIPKTSVS